MFKFIYTAEHTQQVVQVPQPYLLEVVSLLPGGLPPLLATPAPHRPPIGVGVLLFAPCQDTFPSLPTQIWYYHQNRFPVQWWVIPFVLTTVSCSCRRIVLIAVNCFLMFHEIWLSQTVRLRGQLLNLLCYCIQQDWPRNVYGCKEKKFFSHYWMKKYIFWIMHHNTKFFLLIACQVTVGLSWCKSQMRREY